MKMVSVIAGPRSQRVTRSACTVSATSWARMMFAPFRAAIRCAAIEPPRRCDGSDGVTLAMKRLREAPTRMGWPSAAQFAEPRQCGHALLRRLAEADAGIDHDILARDAGLAAI